LEAAKGRLGPLMRGVKIRAMGREEIMRDLRRNWIAIETLKEGPFSQQSSGRGAARLGAGGGKGGGRLYAGPHTGESSLEREQGTAIGGRV